MTSRNLLEVVEQRSIDKVMSMCVSKNISSALLLLVSLCYLNVVIAGDKDVSSFRFPDGSSYKGSVDGEGLLSGFGTLEWQDGAKYEGEFHNGMMHGKGALVYRDGSKYTGIFEYGEIRTGIVKTTNNNVFKGEFVSGLLHNLGEIIYATGARYKGHVKDGLEHGNGILHLSNGDIAQGEFKAGMLHGKARINFNGGGSFDGGFSNGLKSGKGTLIYPMVVNTLVILKMIFLKGMVTL